LKEARREGLRDHFRFVEGDVSEPVVEAGIYYDIHLAHHILHHVQALEHLFSRIEGTMSPESLFLVADVIGRNGHMRWPETLSVVEKLWQHLPLRYRFNHQSRKSEPYFINRDYSKVGFEGIRAQDILPLLNEKFLFEEFIGWGGILDVFIDRAYGPNFSLSNKDDTGFADYVYNLEKHLQIEGIVKPTQMIARLRSKDAEINRAIDVSSYIRANDPQVFPDIKPVCYEFSPPLEKVHQKDPIGADLGDGFYPPESDELWHWTEKSFTFTLQSPVQPTPAFYRLVIDCWIPETDSSGGADLYINRIHIDRIEKIFRGLDRENRKNIEVQFESFGGALEVNLSLDEPFKQQDEADKRELGLIVCGISLYRFRK
jgi:hypothetical protein